MNENENQNLTPESDEPTKEMNMSSEPTEDASECLQADCATPETQEDAQPMKPTESTDETVSSAPSDEQPTVVYRWDYTEQAAADQRTAERGRRRGVVTYAIVMTACFAISFGILIATLITGWGGTLAFGSSGAGNRVVYIRDDYDGSGVLTEQEISAAGNQVVVAISVKTTLGGGVGTGIILTEDGYIATNSHVVNGAQSITVRMCDGTEYAAELIGESELDDLAVVKIQAGGLPVAKLGDSSKALVGDRVVAIGHPAGLEFGWTSTYGRLSAINRDVKIRENDGTMTKKMTLLQTDANVNSGNSGGPLFNEYGEVIGIITMKLSGDYEGIGFAIPINSAMPLLTALMETGTTDGVQSEVSSARAVLGITGVYVKKDAYYVLLESVIQQLTEEEAAVTEGSFKTAAAGVLVTGVTEGTDAVGKLQNGDIITAINGKTIETFESMREYLYDCSVGDTVTLTYVRNGQSETACIVLGAASE